MLRVTPIPPLALVVFDVTLLSTALLTPLTMPLTALLVFAMDLAAAHLNIAALVSPGDINRAVITASMGLTERHGIFCVA